MVVTELRGASHPVLLRDPGVSRRNGRVRTGPSSLSPANLNSRRQVVSEASLNGFPSREIADKIQEDPYRFLVCADKFQTGYDEPLLHTMYVDKPLAGVKAVQTLSRLNRAHPQKHDVAVLDFMNNTDVIEQAFAPYYRTTILAEETDPNKLHDLKSELDALQVYGDNQVDSFVALYLGNADRDQLDPILDACVAVYKEQSRRGRAGRVQGQSQRPSPVPTASLRRYFPTRMPSGRSSRSSSTS